MHWQAKREAKFWVKGEGRSNEIKAEGKKSLRENWKWRTSPVFHAEEAAEVVSHERCNLFEVMSAHPSGQEWLVGISEGSIHQQQTFVGTHRFGKAFRAFFQQNIPKTRWRRS